MLSSKASMSKGLGLRISSKSILLCTASRPMRVSYSATFLLPSGYSKQHISTTSQRAQEVTEKKEKGYHVFLAEKTAHIKKTETSWPHPPFDEKEMKDITVAHRPTKGIADKIAYNAVRFLRFGMDTATGYKPKGQDMDHAFTEREWLIRIIFLESIAGVPGMVGGMLRHLHSLRRLKRDNGWIETLLEEAFNERMHLLTFLSLRSPGIFMRLMLLGAQGVFFNAFFLAYLVSSKTCHRFVGYLEEEAVITYTHCIANLEAGKLPLWEHMEAPQIAIDYWKLPEGHRMMGDLIYYVRADEAKHREVNHTLGNLDQNLDPNPFVSEYTDPNYPHPTKGLKNIKPTGWTRDEAL